MVPISPQDLLLIVIIVPFVLGMISTVTGIILLVTRAMGSDIRTLAVQTTRLAQKGLAEDVAGLVGNASALLDAVNQLVITSAGVGVFLTLFGLMLMTIAGWLALQIN